MQRRRGEPIVMYPQKLVTDSRGNQKYVVDLENPVDLKASFQRERSARAEVPGQVPINIYRVLTDPRVMEMGMGMYSRLHWRGLDWDIVTPIGFRIGSKRTHHAVFDIRERPTAVPNG